MVFFYLAPCTLHLSCSHGDRWGCTDLPTLSLHWILFSASLSEGVATFHPSPLRNYSPNDASFVGPFFSLLAQVPCKIVLASPDDLDTCPNHFYLRFYTVVKISLSWGPMAYLVLSVAASLVMWSLYERPSSMFPKASHLSDLQFLQGVRCQCPGFAGVQQY